MKKIILSALLVISIGAISSCEKKSKAEKFMDDVGKETEKATEEIGEKIEDGAKETEKEAKKSKRKLKDLMN